MKGWVEFTEVREGRRSCRRTSYVKSILQIGESERADEAGMRNGFVMLRGDNRMLFVEESYDELKHLVAAAIGELDGAGE